MSTDLTEGMTAVTVSGKVITFNVRSGVKINDSTITSAETEASNGVIHVIDTVLVPSNYILQRVDLEESEALQSGLPVAIPFFFTAALTARGALVLFKKKVA